MIPPPVEPSRHTSRGQRLFHRLLAHWITTLNRSTAFYWNHLEQTGLEYVVNHPFIRRTLSSGLLFAWLRGGLGVLFPGLAGRGLVGEAGGKYEAGPGWWWSWSRPVTEANWELWETRSNHRPRADTKKASGCSLPSLWLCYRKQRTECWTWKLWAWESVFVVS